MKDGIEEKVTAKNDKKELSDTFLRYLNGCRDGSRKILIDMLDIHLHPTLVGDSRSRKSKRAYFALYAPVPKNVATQQWLCITTIQNRIHASISLRDIV